MLNELQELFETDFVPTTSEVSNNITYKDPKIKIHTWKEVRSVLVEAVTKIEVRAVHGTKNTRQLEYHKIEDINYDDYDNGLSVIAVGGNRLARGITLEGLSVSYYLRTTRLYDSLMQMGRWFGYRPGYVDLCRLYTTEQLINWYRHITLATEEMRADFDVMSAQNKRPVDYRLKVRTHPGLLSITGAGKMREHERVNIGFSGRRIQTYQLNKKLEEMKTNYKSFSELASRLPLPTEKEQLRTSHNKINGFLWQDVNPQLIIDFITGFISDLPTIRPELANYISLQNRKNLLTQWSIAIILNSETNQKVDLNFKDGNTFIGCGLPKRTNSQDAGKNYFTLSKHNIFDPKHRYLDLQLEGANPKEKQITEQRKNEGKSILVIYPLDWESDLELQKGIPLIGWGIVFPEIENEEKVEFAARPMVSDSEEGQVDNDNDIENGDE